jgi:hypothetical protein
MPDECSQSIGPLCLATETSESLPPPSLEQMEFPWMSSAEASPARTSAQQEKAPGSLASVRDYGRNTPVLLASYDQPTSSWRTSQHFLGEGLERFSETWPRSGYDAEWHCIPASAVGAPHRRDRVWIVAYPDIGRRRADAAGRHHANGTDAERSEANGLFAALCAASGSWDLADANSAGRTRSGPAQSEEWRRDSVIAGAGPDVADTDEGDIVGRCGDVQMGSGWLASKIANDDQFGRTQWSPEPDVGRVAHGVPARVDRLGCLGNAVVPQIPELIGRAIMRASEGAAP